jgi:hypothetical protein
MKIFKQHAGTRHVYQVELAGADGVHPLTSKPVWTLAHSRDGEPTSSHDLAALEVSVDGASARLIAFEWPGQVEVTVTASVDSRTTLRDRFQVEIEPIPHVASHQPPTFLFSQHRNGPL